MLDVIKVASYIFERYKAQEKTKIDEMKLHKLLYFAQRECFIQKNEPLFPDRFEAWKYGPVMVKAIFDSDHFHEFNSVLTGYRSSLNAPFRQSPVKIREVPVDNWPTLFDNV